jgi:diguanylate cyclase (GGDEF)-like protein
MKVRGPDRPKPPSAVERASVPDRAEAVSGASAVDSVSVVGVPDEELTPRVRAALSKLLQEVADLRRELADARTRMAELEQLASADPLVGALNRRAFVGELNRALAMAQRYGQPSSLVFVDIDDLKKINDGQGHAAGDAAITHVANVIAANIRQTDVLGRLGGDEFAIILTNTPGEQAALKAKALAALVRETPMDDGSIIGVACGAVEIAANHSAEAVLNAADRAMYEEKRRR